jgi:hypothetical protein
MAAKVTASDLFIFMRRMIPSDKHQGDCSGISHGRRRL